MHSPFGNAGLKLRLAGMWQRAGAVNTALVGPLRKVDVPLAAVDFHVSDVVPFMLTDEACFQRATAVAADPASACSDAEAVLKEAMWMFRSSVTTKRLTLEQISSPLIAPNALLESFWKTVVPAADGFAASFINKRFYS